MRTVVVAAAMLVALSAPAAANGRYPATSNVLFRGDSTDDLYVAATWGLLVSHDGGATWRWTCEKAIGYDGKYDPSYTVTPNGTLFATVFDGLRYTKDFCTWSATSLGDRQVSVVSTAPDGTLWIGVADLDEYRIHKSVDDGVTITPVSTPSLDPVDWWSTIVQSASDPRRVYATGYRIVGGVKMIVAFRSDNGGTSWMPLPVTGFQVSSRSDLEIASVSPQDPSFLIARVTYRTDDDSGDDIYRSIDAGMTWTRIKEFPMDVAPGSVIRSYRGGGQARDSAEVLIGSKASGTWRSTDGGKTFTAVTPALEVGCLKERPDGTLFACGDNGMPDLKAVASSSNATDWQEVLKFQNVTGPIQCSAGTVQKDYCQDELWCTTRSFHHIVANELNCPESGDGGIVPPPPPPPKGCGGCASDGAAGGAIGLVGVGLAFAARRRRRRACCG